MRLRHLNRLTIAASLGASLVASSAGCATSGEAAGDGVGESASKSEDAVSDFGAPLLDQVSARLVRIGGNWVDKPSAFMDEATINTHRAELQKAALGQSADLAFVSCEARGIAFETQDPNECAYLLKGDHGYNFDFFVRGFDDHLQACQILGPACKPHQAIRVRAWNDGSQRPALFVEKRVLADEEATMLVVRPDVDTNDAAVTLTTGFKLNWEVGSRVATDLGFPEESFVNLIHISNKWSAKDHALRLDRERARAIAIVTLPLGGEGVVGAIALLRAGAAMTTVSRALTIFGIVSGAAGFVGGTVDLFGLKQVAQTLPADSAARRVLSSALFIANIAPYLSAANMGSHLLRGASSALLRARAIDELATSKGVLVKSLTKDEMARVSGGVEAATDEIAGLLMRGEREQAAARMAAYSKDVVARFDRLRATPERPWIPSGSNAEALILANQSEQRSAFGGFVEKWSDFRKTDGGTMAPPAGVREDLKQGYQEIIDFMHDSKRVYARLQQLESEVAKRVRANGETPEKALDAILTALEKKHRFAALKELTVLDRDTIASGTPFRHVGFAAGQAHGQQIHRIQWNLLVREMDAKPQVFGAIPGVEYYKEFASLDVQGVKSWNQPWDDLFDSFSTGPTSPEKFRNVESMLPMIGHWE